MAFSHKPVLLSETIESLMIKPDGIYVDGTLGGGGHSSEILKRLSEKGRLIGIDRDIDAINAASERLAQFGNFKAVRANYRDIKSVLENENIDFVDGILLDIGVSSYQLDTADRGFSYLYDAPLDMRMSQSGMTAADVVNKYSEQELVRVFREYGEERFSSRIAEAIVKARKVEPIVTTAQLSNMISENVPAKYRRESNPSRQVFQAIRIEVNDELGALRDGLDAAFSCLKIGGVLSVITFHSLEDRIVKHKFKDLCTGCICPKDFPVCVCGRKPIGGLVTRKPIRAGEEELNENKRSRSATLRAIKKIAADRY